ncbi:alpha/beta fold hydrolase [Micromonospora sp. NBC_01796]|uniref:alpha/beta fold hydrolase n=1 Tax=Micromonospora sp. NBC_01796 TaxID=2975987 RepID=UPI002DDA23CB|nr:alpha/beta hydrolase [Micromonospora sp. NBC_01796]WSA84790.1 alpha/beta hydrolase [Micromonospora sp. NBC_01796]
MDDAPRRYFGDLAAGSYGTGDDRPPLVLLHGMSYDRRQWGPVLRELAVVDPGRRVVAFDLPGHGDSPRRNSYHSDEVAAVIHRAVTDAGLEAPVLVGHSLGGVLATIYAATYPARGVVNVDQPLLVGNFGKALRRAEPVLRSAAHGEVWDSMLARMHIDLLPPDARELVRTATTPRQDLLLGYWNEILVTPADELGERRMRDLDTIRSSGIPYHYVTGAEPDPAYRRWLEAALPDAVVDVLPGSGHFPHLAHPDRLARIMAG